MCGRFQASSSPAELARWFETTGPVPNLQQRYNAAPGQHLPIVLCGAMTHVSIVLASGALVCGLIAAWWWYQSSQIEIDPGWSLPGMPGGKTRRGFPRVPQPANSEL